MGRKRWKKYNLKKKHTGRVRGSVHRLQTDGSLITGCGAREGFRVQIT